MTTVVLVHGTGVRRTAFSVLAGRVTAGLTALRDDLRFVPYYWGDVHGAELAAGGASIPPETGGDRGIGGFPDDSAADHDTAAWAALYADPDAELRLAAAHRPGERPPGSALPEQWLQDRLTTLRAEVDHLAPEWAAGVADAAARLHGHPLLGQAAASVSPDELAVLAARVLVAEVVSTALDAGHPLVPDGRSRDELLDRLARYLGAGPRGSERSLRTLLLGTAGAVASRALLRRRHALTQAAHPAAGDVLRYLCRGEGVRTELRDLVADLDPPVTLIGHSLGGIIALDTLVTTALPQVRLLVTVGSQAPFLYESGSLPSLTHPRELPPHVPDWLNLYDPRDMLSYVGARLFPGRVTDTAVDNGQPFPAAHSAYWTNPDVYRSIAERLP
ncbi:alpha/beta fold hydrolase [Streptomyces koelreuteriae]|uniref:alpha/beta fold hydrolase n=1 Tax=Streptomyces koelreuteriae TaxID=2838015 RepID=UPI003EBB8262